MEMHDFARCVYSIYGVEHLLRGEKYQMILI